jgi:hypothetical protein
VHVTGLLIRFRVRTNADMRDDNLVHILPQQQSDLGRPRLLPGLVGDGEVLVPPGRRPAAAVQPTVVK